MCNLCALNSCLNFGGILLGIMIPILVESHRRRKERKREMLEKLYCELFASLDAVVLHYEQYNVARAKNELLDNRNYWQELQNTILPLVCQVQIALSKSELVFDKDGNIKNKIKNLEDNFIAYIKKANSGSATTEKEKIEEEKDNLSKIIKENIELLK